MAWSIKKKKDGYHWSCFQSAYGAASGVSPTLAAAKIELAIGQAAVMEQPYPRAVCEVMRSDPERFAADFEDPQDI